MNEAYESLGATDRSRINTVIINAFREAGPEEWKHFRDTMTRAVLKTGGDYDKAYQLYIDNMRDVLAKNIGRLPNDVMNGNDSVLDIGAERATLRNLREVLKAETQSGLYWSAEQMKGMITDMGNRYGVPEVGKDGQTFKLTQLMEAADPKSMFLDPEGKKALGLESGTAIQGGIPVAMGETPDHGLHIMAAANKSVGIGPA